MPSQCRVTPVHNDLHSTAGVQKGKEEKKLTAVEFSCLGAKDLAKETYYFPSIV